MRNSLCRSILAATLFAASSAEVLAAPIVVASIKPIHAIAATVMEGIAEPTLLLDAGVSEHTAQLKPSQLETLTKADIILVVGENLEAFLQKALDSPDISGKTLVELGELEAITPLPLRSGDLWEKHVHEGEEEHEHGHGVNDPHIWMDPENAKIIAAKIAELLSTADPANANKYVANRNKFVLSVDSLSAETKDKLQPVLDKRYIVFHDAYQYFENRFGLNPAGSITINPETAPGAKRLAEIHKRIADTGAACVFAEPQFQSKYVQTVIEGTGARTGVLDGLGAAIPAGPGAYEALLRKFVSDLTGCLRG